MCSEANISESKYSSVINALKRLHWLPIRARIDFKVLLLVYKCLKLQGPKYLMDLLMRNERNSNLRSGDNKATLIVLYVSNQTSAPRSFAVSGPKLWNKLPNNIRMCESTEYFKRKLKGYFFDQYLNNNGDWIFY